MPKLGRREGVHVIITGGTIDFDFSPAYEIETGEVDLLVPQKRSVIPQYFQDRVKTRPGLTHFSRACLKDSRQLTDKDLETIKQHIVASPYDRILISHGISRMNDTIRYLSEQIDEFDNRAIGVVGSRMPLIANRSDAGFHLGYAFGKIENMPGGIHSFHPEKNQEGIKTLFEGVVFLLTGGTIDSGYSETADSAVPYEHSRIPEYFKQQLCIDLPEPDLIFREICMKDSRQLTPNDITDLLEQARVHSHKKQIITMGTYALPDNGNMFNHMLQQGLPPSTYVFIGSMFPDDVRMSDSTFNLGYAVGRIEDLNDGVYVGMHGWMTPPTNVIKQLYEGRFNLFNTSLRS